jgi:hypothetical protein
MEPLYAVIREIDNEVEVITGEHLFYGKRGFITCSTDGDKLIKHVQNSDSTFDGIGVKYTLLDIRPFVRQGFIRREKLEELTL